MNFDEAYQKFVESCVGQDILRVPERLNGTLVEEIPQLMGVPQSFKEVWLPESVQRIESHAFDEWSQLCKIHLPQEMEYIGAYAFSETGLRELRLPDGIKYLGNSICYGCHSLESVHLGDGLETIGTGAFWDCKSLRQIVIPGTVRRIMNAAFQDCENLVWIRFDGKVEAIASSAFANCGNVVLVESSQVEQNVEVISHTDVMMESLHIIKQPKRIKDKEMFMSLFNLQAIPVIPNLIDVDITSLEYAQEGQRAEKYGQALENLQKTKPKEKSVKERIVSCLKTMTINLSKEESLEERIVSFLDVAVQAKCLGQFRTALDLCKQALALKPTNGVAFYNLAKILYLVGQGTAVVKALSLAELNVYKANISKLYGLAGHVYLDVDIKIQKTYIGEILAYRSWAAGHRAEKPVTGYELLCEIEGKKRLEERYVKDSIPFCKEMLREQLEQDLYDETDQHTRQMMVSISHNNKALSNMAKEMAHYNYQNKRSMNNEIGKFDDDNCYV